MSMIQKIEGNGKVVCTRDEREYIFKSTKERKRFEKFMVALGYNHTGPYVSDAGITVIFY